MSEIDRKLASVIDHTLLRPEADAREVERLCVEALRFGFATVCVQPVWVARAAHTLAGSRVGVASVVAFPHGANLTAIKVAEAARARDDGATELDVVANLGAIRAGDAAAVRAEIAAVVEAARGAPVKVILETSLWSPERITAAAARPSRAAPRSSRRRRASSRAAPPRTPCARCAPPSGPGSASRRQAVSGRARRRSPCWRRARAASARRRRSRS